MKKIIIPIIVLSLLFLIGCQLITPQKSECVTDQDCRDKYESCVVICDRAKTPQGTIGKCQFTGLLMPHQSPPQYPECEFKCEEGYKRGEPESGGRYWKCVTIEECQTNQDCLGGWVCSFGKCYPTGECFKEGENCVGREYNCCGGLECTSPCFCEYGKLICATTLVCTKPENSITECPTERIYCDEFFEKHPNLLTTNGQIACYEIWKPVCGSDGKLYGNDCGACVHGKVRWFTIGECN